MSAAVGGSIESVTLDGRPFAVAADAEATRSLGGWENEVMANGNGTARLIKTRMPLKIEGLQVETDDFKQDHEHLRDLANRPDFFPIAITYASGITYQARAQITGDFAGNSKNAVTAINLSGPGLLTRQ